MGTINANIPLIEATAVTTTQTSLLQTNIAGRGIKIVFDVTAISGVGGSLTLTLQGVDKTSGKLWSILVSAVITVTGTTVLTVYPGIAAVANVSANDVLPYYWDVEVVPSGSTATYTVGASVIL